MTNKEAIEALKHTVGNINYDAKREEIYFTDEWVQAYEMAIAALREQSKVVDSDQFKWISVKDKLPEKGKFVLLSYAKNNRNPTQFAKNTMAVGRFEYGKFLVEGCCVSVTHWMPLPEPPEEEV